MAGLLNYLALVVCERDFWPANGAGGRLSVEAAVSDVGVLGLAFGTHGELAHSGVLAVVGDFFDNGVSRAAICAVYEWIWVP